VLPGYSLCVCIKCRCGCPGDNSLPISTSGWLDAKRCWGPERERLVYEIYLVLARLRLDKKLDDFLCLQWRHIAFSRSFCADRERQARYHNSPYLVFKRPLRTTWNGELLHTALKLYKNIRWLVTFCIRKNSPLPKQIFKPGLRKCGGKISDS